MSTSLAPQLFDHYQEAIERAVVAVHERTFYAHYPEPPSGKIYGEDANEAGQKAFEAQVGNPFPLQQDADQLLNSDEMSPYTRKHLGIDYPIFDTANGYVTRSKAAQRQWRNVDLHSRAAILMASLDKVKERFFELAYATMHTTGQAFVMAFQASGPHANDRAIEAIALGLHEQTRFPQDQVAWVKPMGKFDVTMHKRYKPMPLGVGLCIGCSTFPVWNTVPGIYANLITGNSAIVKPHPTAIYPIAVFVQALQEVLVEQDLDPHTVLLAADKVTNPVTNLLAEHPDVKLIDFTGSSAYGDHLEGLKGKKVFTEKTGVNSVILESCDDLKAVMNNLAFSVSMYSGQMCTCPQNIFIPKDGIEVAGEKVSFDQVTEALTKAIHGLVSHPKMGAGVTGAVQSEATFARVREAESLGKVLLASQSIDNPQFPEARMASPLVLQVTAEQREVFGKELFGPIVLVIPTENIEHSVQLARELAADQGAISCSAYTTDEATMGMIESEMAEAFTPVSFNFTGMFWVNQNAGFSDFHVTGGNPAGNASLTDPQYILGRYVMIGTRIFQP